MKTILVLTDFSQKAEHAARMALQIADAANAEIHLYTTFPAPQVFPSDAGVFPFFEDFSVEEAMYNTKLKDLSGKLIKRFDRIDHPVISFSSSPGNLAENIEELKPWLIVMGGKTKASSLGHFLFGSNSSAVMDKASCPVLIVPETADLKEFRKIVFATDLQPSEKNALLFLEEFGRLWRARIIVLHVSVANGTDEVWDEQYDYLNDIISDNHPTIQYTDVRGTDIAGAINMYSGREAINLIAIAHKKRSFIGQLLHKSIGKDMLNYEHVPVLILHQD